MLIFCLKRSIFCHFAAETENNTVKIEELKRGFQNLTQITQTILEELRELRG